MDKKNAGVILSVFILGLTLAACETTSSSAEKLGKEEDPKAEALWIRNGEPIVFEGESWYPQDDVENLLEDEVSKIATYRGLPIYIEKIDVRPYDRLYTRFSTHKFRYFEKRTNP